MALETVTAEGSGSFAAFVEDAASVVREFSAHHAIVERMEPLLQRLVRDPSWLLPPFRRPSPDKPYAQYLLYRPPDYAFSVVSFVWNPHQGSPVHDHCTWGVVAQLEGEEDETRYRRVGSRIEEARTVTGRPGDVSHVYPPDRDIHRIWNPTGSPTISIHIYGGDIGSQPRHVYDLDSGDVKHFVSGYDAVILFA